MVMKTTKKKKSKMSLTKMANAESPPEQTVSRTRQWQTPSVKYTRISLVKANFVRASQSTRNSLIPARTCNAWKSTIFLKRRDGQSQIARILPKFWIRRERVLLRRVASLNLDGYLVLGRRNCICLWRVRHLFKLRPQCESCGDYCRRR